jgi:hypothetical protein
VQKLSTFQRLPLKTSPITNSMLWHYHSFWQGMNPVSFHDIKKNRTPKCWKTSFNNAKSFFL